MRKHLTVAGISLCLCVTAARAAPDNLLETSLAEASASAREGAQTQERIDTLQSETTDLRNEYRSVIQQYERVQLYNDNLGKLISSQMAEVAKIEDQLASVEVTRREIMPLMLDMVADLEEVVKRDTPFLPDERNARIDKLKTLMEDANVTVAEKFRRVMSAYQVEADYGRTIEAYNGKIELDGEPREVDFLRVGRLVLAYQTQDAKQTGYWNKSEKRWDTMSAGDARFVREGIRIARRQAAPGLLRLPVAAPEDAR